MPEKPGNTLEANMEPIPRRDLPTELHDLFRRSAPFQELLPGIVVRKPRSLVGGGLPPCTEARIVNVDPHFPELDSELLREHVVRIRTLRDAARQPTQVRPEVV